MKQTICVLLTVVLFLFQACSDGNSNEAKEPIARGNEQNTYGIELVNNEKWKVNEEMMIHIKNMESDVKSVSTENADSLDWLGQKLDEHIGLLTSNCTMTGKAHDELHKWLLPFIDLVEELNDAATNEEQRDCYEKISASLEEFNVYFN